MKLIDGELLHGEKRCPTCWWKRQSRNAAMVWCAVYWIGVGLSAAPTLQFTLALMVVFTVTLYVTLVIRHPPHA